MKRLVPVLAALLLPAAQASTALARPAQVTLEGQVDCFVTGESCPTPLAAGTVGGWLTRGWERSGDSSPKPV